MEDGGAASLDDGCEGSETPHQRLTTTTCSAHHQLHHPRQGPSIQYPLSQSKPFDYFSDIDTMDLSKMFLKKASKDPNSKKYSKKNVPDSEFVVRGRQVTYPPVQSQAVALPRRLPAIRPVSGFAISFDSFPLPPSASQWKPHTDTKLIKASAPDNDAASFDSGAETVAGDKKLSYTTSKSSNWSGSTLNEGIGRMSSDTPWSGASSTTLVDRRKLEPAPRFSLVPRISRHKIIWCNTFSYKTLKYQLEDLVKHLRFKSREDDLDPKGGKLKICATMQYCIRDTQHITLEAERLLSQFQALYNISESDWTEQEAMRYPHLKRLDIDYLIPRLRKAEVEHPFRCAIKAWLRTTAIFAVLFSKCFEDRGCPFSAIKCMHHYYTHLNHVRSLVQHSEILYFKLETPEEEQGKLDYWRWTTDESKRKFLATFDKRMPQESRKPREPEVYPEQDKALILPPPARKPKGVYAALSRFGGQEASRAMPRLRHVASLTDVFKKSHESVPAGARRDASGASLLSMEVKRARSGTGSLLSMEVKRVTSGSSSFFGSLRSRKSDEPGSLRSRKSDEPGSLRSRKSDEPGSLRSRKSDEL
ncbi:hypothetical protein EDC01DRAFT_731940 [Geopyxis carbonaria]|nr:hypothetical protein EDC01DRAFT_731940 [Geopyxis carbonaria]